MGRPQVLRMAGFLYLAVIATGMFSELYVRQALRVPGDALATSRLIMEHEDRYRWGVIADLANFVLGIPILVILYRVFRERYPQLATTALCFALVQTAVNAINMIFQLVPLNLLNGDQLVQGMAVGDRAVMSALALQLQAQGYGIGLLFFGAYCIIVGYILFRGKYLPAGLAILYILAGVLYILNTLIMFLDHGFNNPWFIYMMLPIFLAELGLALWLVFRGLRN